MWYMYAAIEGGGQERGNYKREWEHKTMCLFDTI